MANQTPYPVISAPATIYLGPVGESEPDVDDAPAGNWTQLGSSGAENYHEDGIEIAGAQALEFFRSLASTAPIKAVRVSEDLMFKVQLVDTSPDEYAHWVNEATVTTTAAASGVPGDKRVPLYRGADVAQVSALIRMDVSPIDGGTGAHKAQWWIPKIVQSGDYALPIKKGEWMGSEMEWTALYDTTNQLGHFRAQNADAV